MAQVKAAHVLSRLIRSRHAFIPGADAAPIGIGDGVTSILDVPHDGAMSTSNYRGKGWNFTPQSDRALTGLRFRTGSDADQEARLYVLRMSGYATQEEVLFESAPQPATNEVLTTVDIPGGILLSTGVKYGVAIQKTTAGGIHTGYGAADPSDSHFNHDGYLRVTVADVNAHNGSGWGFNFSGAYEIDLISEGIPS